VRRLDEALAIDRWRTLRRARGRTVGDVTTLDPDPERIDLYRALDALPRRQRNVVVLRFLADMPESAVAELLGCSIGTVKSSASRARAALRAVLTIEEDQR
jgi:RNA polymerase sigma factor (sigma-70 family)